MTQFAQNYMTAFNLLKLCNFKHFRLALLHSFIVILVIILSISLLCQYTLKQSPGISNV